MNGFGLECPDDEEEDATQSRDSSWPTYLPNHSAFEPPSCVKVPVPGEIILAKRNATTDEVSLNPDLLLNEDSRTDKAMMTDANLETNDAELEDSDKRQEAQPPASNAIKTKVIRRPVKDRWFYEPITVIAGSPHVPEPLPDYVGTTQAIDSEDMGRIENNEQGACELHGTLFHDDEIDWWRASSGLLFTIIDFQFSV